MNGLPVGAMFHVHYEVVSCLSAGGTAAGDVTTLAGNGTGGYAEGLAGSASFNMPTPQ